MKQAPADLDRRRVRDILRQIRTLQAISHRMKEISRQFLGLPYVTNPLGGSPGLPETLSVSVDGFDCVTYVETVLALARSDTVDEFVDHIRQIRYKNGLVDWKLRNHYMSVWIRNNFRSGFLTPFVRGDHAKVVGRTLNVVRGLPALAVKMKCFPKREFSRLRHRIGDGDLIFFVSTRKNLDVFHCGILLHAGGRILLRHAARSRQSVVEQELPDFLHSNRMSGFILVRPSEPVGRMR